MRKKAGICMSSHYLFCLCWVIIALCRLSCLWHVGTQFPDQGSNPWSLHWKADSQLLDHQGSSHIVLLRLLWKEVWRGGWSSWGAWGGWIISIPDTFLPSNHADSDSLWVPVIYSIQSMYDSLCYSGNKGLESCVFWLRSEKDETRL